MPLNKPVRVICLLKISYMFLDSLKDFTEPVNKAMLNEDEEYREAQVGRNVFAFEEEFPDIAAADVVLIGCAEMRGAGRKVNNNEGPDEVRKEFYRLYQWHNNLQIADVGNIKQGATLQDTYAALKTVIKELAAIGKKVAVIGGSHDLMLAQYQSYADNKQSAEAVCVDALINIDTDSSLPHQRFLMDMLTGEPNYVSHYNHIGFQSYFVHPHMLETIDKLRFDLYRVGHVKERIEDMEPVIRNAGFFAFDIAAIQHSHAPCNTLTPNGFNGEEACTLMQYAGMSSNISSVGLYGYDLSKDVHSLSAKQLSHMLWYYVDGLYKAKQESAISERDNFNHFELAFAEIETSFLQSKKTGRWWMQLPGGSYIACSYKDYVAASQNEIPERWMRAVERS
jgi:formiminoglutamase